MPRLVVIALLLSLCVGACGSDTDAPSSAPLTSGHKTPEALVDYLADLTRNKRFSPVEFVALVHPDEQKATALVLGVFPLMVVPLALALGGKDESKEKKREEMESFLLELGELMKKYGLEDMKEKLGAMGSPADLSEEQKLKGLNDAMADVDHLAFMAESWALIKRVAETTGSKDGPLAKASSFSVFTSEAVEKARASLKVDGKTATMQAPSDEEKTWVLVQEEDGFWYVSSLQSKLLER